MRVVLLLVVTMAVLAGCAKSGSEEAFARANRMLQSKRPGDLKESVAFFKKSIELEMRARNQLVTAYKKIADRAIRQAGWKMEQEDLDRHVKSRVNAQAGVSAISLGFYNEAISYLEKAVKLTPNDRFLHFHLGVCYAQLSLSAPTLGDRGTYREMALKEYKTALRLDSGYTAAAFGIAFIQMSWDNNKEAVETLLEIMKREPREPRVYFALGRAYYGLKEYGKAESMYRTLLDLLPANSPQLEQVKRNITILRQRQ